MVLVNKHYCKYTSILDHWPDRTTNPISFQCLLILTFLKCSVSIWFQDALHKCLTCMLHKYADHNSKKWSTIMLPKLSDIGGLVWKLSTYTVVVLNLYMDDNQTLKKHHNNHHWIKGYSYRVQKICIVNEALLCN